MSMNEYDDCIPSPCQAFRLEMNSLNIFLTLKELRVHEREGLVDKQL